MFLDVCESVVVKFKRIPVLVVSILISLRAFGCEPEIGAYVRFDGIRLHGNRRRNQESE